MIKDKWPNRWDYHISQYCNLYFCDKDIEYLDRNLWTEITTDNIEKENVRSMNLRFHIGGEYYLVNIGRGDGSHFSCTVFHKSIAIPPTDPYEPDVNYCRAGFVGLLDDVAGIGGTNMTAISLMEFAENGIKEDYKRRKGNDGDDDNNGENDPVEPFSPTGIVEPELTFV